MLPPPGVYCYDTTCFLMGDTNQNLPYSIAERATGNAIVGGGNFSMDTEQKHAYPVQLM